MTDFEKEISDKIYEKLQEFLYECMDKGYEIKGFDTLMTSFILTINGKLGIEITDEDGSGPFYLSFHDFFSVDYGIMEFVNWKEYNRSVFNGEGSAPSKVDGHYMLMGTMNEMQKIKYFLKNAVLPQ